MNRITLNCGYVPLVDCAPLVIAQELGQAPREAVGIGVHQADARDPIDVAQGLHQVGQLETDVPPPRRGVLGDEHQLAHAVLRELRGLARQGIDRFGAMRAADRGDRAEAALVVAAVRDAQEGIAAGRREQARALALGIAQVGIPSYRGRLL